MTEDLKFIHLYYWNFPSNFFLEVENRMEGMGCRFQTIAHLDFLLWNSIIIGKWGKIFFLSHFPIFLDSP